MQITKLESCRLCGENNFRKVFTTRGFDAFDERFELVECQNCNLIRTEPTLSDLQLAKYYPMVYYGNGEEKFTGFIEKLTYYFNYKFARRLFVQLSNHRRTQDVPPRILDIGCGRGNLLKILQRMGCECYGVERKNFPADSPGKGIHFYKESLDNIPFNNDFFDVAIMWYALEHMADPVSIIRKTNKILSPKGMLVVAVPNIESFQSKQFGARWFHLDVPRHTHHFSVHTLTQCLKRNGFNIISVRACSIEQSIYGFIQSLFNRVMPSAKANSLYALLKKRDGFIPTLNLLGWLGLASLIFPYAILEYLIFKILKKSALIKVYAEKS